MKPSKPVVSCLTPTQFLRTLRRFHCSRGARTRACRVDTRVDAWRYLTSVAAPPLCGAGNFARSRLQAALLDAARIVAPGAPAESRRQPGLAAPQSSGAATNVGERQASTRVSTRHARVRAPRKRPNLRRRIRIQRGVIQTATPSQNPISTRAMTAPSSPSR